MGAGYRPLETVLVTGDGGRQRACFSWLITGSQIPRTGFPAASSRARFQAKVSRCRAGGTQEKRNVWQG